VLTPELPLAKLLLHTLAHHRVTHFYAVGSILALMTGDGSALDRHDLSALRVLQTGAEVCNPRVVNAWLSRLPQLCFLNSYGPTEVTVGCACFVKSTSGPLPAGDVPIGTLHEGSVALLLDQHGGVIDAPDVEGELAVGGTQVMRGYLARPDEEQRVFMVHAGERFYRTGDIVRRDAQGVLRYVGRRDHEVKIDGCRVHLSETLRALQSHPRVQAAIVGTLRDGAGRTRVGAAVTLGEGADVALGQAVLRHLAEALPAPFMPAGLMVCAELPRTSTGKADRAQLMARLAHALARQPMQRVFFAGEHEDAFEAIHDQAAAE
jgi:D-alanine--poly(phosphoribitol) ligase subunit 1